MKSYIRLYLVLFALIGGVLISSCQQNEPEKKEMTHEELVERGKYIVETSGCHDCHSPKTMVDGKPVPDENYLLGGHPSDWPIPEYDKALVKDWALFSHTMTATVGPWGISFAANITSDDTGLGSWTFEQFKTAMTKGLYKGLEGSRPIMPPMPWQEFKNYTEEDLRAIFTYLQSTKPVNNVPPAYIPPDQM